MNDKESYRQNQASSGVGDWLREPFVLVCPYFLCYFRDFVVDQSLFGAIYLSSWCLSYSAASIYPTTKRRREVTIDDQRKIARPLHMINDCPFNFGCTR